MRVDKQLPTPADNVYATTTQNLPLLKNEKKAKYFTKTSTKLRLVKMTVLVRKVSCMRCSRKLKMQLV